MVTTDPKTGRPGNTGVITFGIKVMPFDQQKALIDDIRAQINPPGGPAAPPGVKAEVLGLPVLAADANSALSGSRYLVTVAGLLAVALLGVLLVLPAALVWAEGGFQPAPTLIARFRRRGRPAPADVH